MIDELESLLGPPETGAKANRAALLAVSTRIVHRRFVLRRIGSWGSVLAVFAIGGATDWLLKPTRVERETLREIVFVAPEPTPAVETKAYPKPELVALRPGDLELKAELSDDPAEVARLYREAGDKYLSDARDYTQAARCYRLHLEAGSDETRKVSAADSWLLMSMKSPTREGE